MKVYGAPPGVTPSSVFGSLLPSASPMRRFRSATDDSYSFAVSACTWLTEASISTAQAERQNSARPLRPDPPRQTGDGKVMVNACSSDRYLKDEGAPLCTTAITDPSVRQIGMSKNDAHA